MFLLYRLYGVVVDLPSRLNISSVSSLWCGIYIIYFALLPTSMYTSLKLFQHPTSDREARVSILDLLSCSFEWSVCLVGPLKGFRKLAYLNVLMTKFQCK